MAWKTICQEIKAIKNGRGLPFFGFCLSPNYTGHSLILKLKRNDWQELEGLITQTALF